jgi:hypothetical protein
MLPENELDKIKALFDSLSDSDFAELLANEIFDIDRLGNFDLNLFSKVIGNEKITNVMPLTITYISDNFLGNKQKLKKKIEHLLNGLTDPAWIEIYKNNFSSLLNNLSSAEDISFDRNLISTNYRLIILTLFLCEVSKDSLAALSAEIIQELKKMTPDADFEYLSMLINVLEKKKNSEKGQGQTVFSEVDKEIAVIVENQCWDASAANLQNIIDYPKSSVMGIQFYLSKIFGERKINSAAFNLFLKFFPNKLNLFYELLKKECSDIEFTERVLSILKTLDTTMLLDILEQVYLFSHNYIKMEIIRIMGESGNYRKEFLLNILSKEDAALKKEVLLTLIKEEKIKQDILASFFSVDDPWNVNSNVLMSNLEVVDELAIKDAKDYLVDLNKKIFFWNWKVKAKIRSILNKWK